MQKNLVLYGLIIGLVAGGLVYLRWNRRLDSCLGSCISRYHYHVGAQAVTLAVRALVDGDNGAAMIVVTVNDQQSANINASFNYDTLMDLPAAYVHYWWQDGDLYPDLLIMPTTVLSNTRYYLGSRDGELHEIANE